jgi:hypothetical protein
MALLAATTAAMIPRHDLRLPCLHDIANREHRMSKPKKTATELEKIIMDELINRNECPYGMGVSVVRLGATWTVLTLGTDRNAYADCVSRITRIADELKKQFDLAD